MLNLLENSGLPIYLEDRENLLAFLAPLVYESYGRKVTRQMDGLLRDMAGASQDEPYYDVYRDIRFASDEPLLRKDQYRYDITLIMPGQVNGECKKTSGHYHGYNPTRTNTYAEVYEVIAGTAIYVMQRADNFEDSPEKLRIDDIIIARVEAGQTILIPPNYGHCSVNGGDGPLVFSNLCYVPCPVNYAPVKHYHGMSHYVMREKGRLSFPKNPHYGKVPMPEPKFAVVRENPRLGVKFGKPVYGFYRENPSAYHFLGSPDGYGEDILSMLEMVKSI